MMPARTDLVDLGRLRFASPLSMSHNDGWRVGCHPKGYGSSADAFYS
jgi:hypothetical protein